MKHILLVEDNPANLKLVQTILDAHDLSYDSATNGTEALQLADLNDYQLLILDLQLPDISGYTVLRSVRASKPDIPAIAVTGNATTADHEAAEQAGFNHFIRKPFEIDQLMATIQMHLRPAVEESPSALHRS